MNEPRTMTIPADDFAALRMAVSDVNVMAQALWRLEHDVQKEKLTLGDVAGLLNSLHLAAAIALYHLGSFTAVETEGGEEA